MAGKEFIHNKIKCVSNSPESLEIRKINSPVERKIMRIKDKMAQCTEDSLGGEDAPSARDLITIIEPAITKSLTHSAFSNFFAFIRGVPYVGGIGGLLSCAGYSIPVARAVRYLYTQDGREEISKLFTSSDRLWSFISRVWGDILDMAIPVAGNMVVSSFMTPDFSLKVKEALEGYLGDAAGWLFKMDDNEEENRIRHFLFSAIAISALVLYYNKIKNAEPNNRRVSKLRRIVDIITRGLFFGHGLIQHTIDLAPNEMIAEPRSVDIRYAERKSYLKVSDFIKKSPPEEHEKLCALRTAVEQNKGHLTIENLIQFYQGEEVAGEKLSMNFTTPYPGAIDNNIDYHTQRLAQLYQIRLIPEPQNAFMGASAQETVGVTTRQDEQEQEQMSWWRWGLNAIAAISMITLAFSSLLSLFYSKRQSIRLPGAIDTEEIEMSPRQLNTDFQSDGEDGVLINIESQETQEEEEPYQSAKKSRLLRAVQIASATTTVTSVAASLLYPGTGNAITKNTSVSPTLSNATTPSIKNGSVLSTPTNTIESNTIPSSIRREIDHCYDSLLVDNGIDLTINQNNIEHLKDILSRLSLAQLEELAYEVSVQSDNSDITQYHSIGKKVVKRSVSSFYGVDENIKKNYIVSQSEKFNTLNEEGQRLYHNKTIGKFMLLRLIMEIEIDKGKSIDQSELDIIDFQLQALNDLFRYRQNIVPATELIRTYLTDTFSDAVRFIISLIGNIEIYNDIFGEDYYSVVKNKIRSMELQVENDQYRLSLLNSTDDNYIPLQTEITRAEKNVAIYNKVLDLTEKSIRLYLLNDKGFNLNGIPVSDVIQDIKNIQRNLSYYTISERNIDLISLQLNSIISSIDPAYKQVEDYYLVRAFNYVQNILKNKTTTPLSFKKETPYQELINSISNAWDNKDVKEKLDAGEMINAATNLLLESDNVRTNASVHSDVTNIYARSLLESIYQTDTHHFEHLSTDDVESTELIYSYSDKNNNTKYDTASFYEYMSRYVSENDSSLATRNNIDIKFPREFPPGLVYYLEQEARNVQEFNNVIKQLKVVEEKLGNLSRLLPDPNRYLEVFLAESGKKYNINNLRLSDKVIFNYKYYTHDFNAQALGDRLYPPVEKVFTVRDILIGKERQWLAENYNYNNIHSPKLNFPGKYSARLINEIKGADIQRIYQNNMKGLKNSDEVKREFYSYMRDLLISYNRERSPYYLILNSPALLVYAAPERGPRTGNDPIKNDNIDPQHTPIEVVSMLSGRRLVFSSFRYMKQKIQHDEALKDWFTLHFPFDYIMNAASMRLVKKGSDYSYSYENILQNYINNIDVLVRSHSETAWFELFKRLDDVSIFFSIPAISMGPVSGFLYGSAISAGPLFGLAATSDTVAERDRYLREAAIAVAFEAGGEAVSFVLGKSISKVSRCYSAYKASKKLLSVSEEVSDDYLKWMKEPGTGSLKSEWKVNDVSLDDINVGTLVIDGIDYNKIYRISGGQYYIKEAGNIYQVRWDTSAHTWRVVNPVNSGSLMYAVPVKLNKEGHWVTHSNVGLKGGAPIRHRGKAIDHLNNVSQTQASEVRSLIWAAKDKSGETLKKVNKKVKSTNEESIRNVDKTFEIFFGKKPDGSEVNRLKEWYISVIEKQEEFLTKLKASKDISYQGGYDMRNNPIIFQTEDSVASIPRSGNKPLITVYVDSVVDANQRLSYSKEKFENFISTALIHESYHAVSVRTPDLSYPKVHQNSLDISGIVSLSEPLLRDNPIRDIIKNRELMEKVFKDSPEVISLLNDVEKNKQELIKIVKDRLDISDRRVLQNPDNISYMTTLISYIDNNRPLYDDFINKYNIWKRNMDAPLLWDFKGDHTGNVMSFENTDIGKLRHGDISPLKERGYATGSKTENIDLEFDYIRNDKDIQMQISEHFTIEEITGDNGKLHGVMNTWKGAAVTSRAIDGTMPGFWGDKFTLSDNVNFITVTNGHSGVVAVKIPLNEIQEGKPVIITGGRLSGCSIIYAVDDGYFYTYHFGQQGGDTGWLTSRDGVASLYDTHLKLTNKALDGLETGRVMSNNDIVDIFSKYEKSVITYLGRDVSVGGNAKITKEHINVGIFDYNQISVEIRDQRLILSYALLVKDNGNVKIKVYSEDILFEVGGDRRFSKLSGKEFPLKE
ncbi:cytotoxic necrotizing factor Rho-activating domain-containing protein [Serratia quinivorans]|uniref:cytotoxic necrotizing factor Rho-activating domain-containing protein n=1 Tax=Serratia quinivorans TaxID=137545 RepID=UPI0021BD8803|nr:cytotoxic necrotizing factor Rho-activating domain-containing protein [Serratia quinivorans]